MTHGSLFSGIGGFDLAASWAGFENIFQVEKDEFCQKILTKNFPNTDKHRDIYEFDANNYSGTIDVISGGFPCQPFSHAGKRRGTADDRYLWDEMYRVVSEIRPSWVIAENVYGLITISGGLVFEKCVADLEAAGYEVQPFIIPAISKNAPHRRDRIWIVANSDGSREQQCCRNDRDVRQRTCDCVEIDATDAASIRVQGFDERQREIQPRGNSWGKHWFEVATTLCRVDDGLPRQLDRAKRIKALGNAIVPQVAYELFRIIKQIEKDL